MDDRMPADRFVIEVFAEDSPLCSTGVDLVSDRLFALGASAVSEREDDHGRVLLVADLPVTSIDRLGREVGQYRLLEVDPTWSTAWRQHARSVPVGERLVLRPEWVPTDSDGPLDAAWGDRIEVVLDAAEAFGSGSHPTTRLCLEALERLGPALERARVLDVGCGTGVLGVAALAMGAGSLVAVDVDPAAVVATRRTAELNGVADRVIEVSDRPVAEVTAEHGAFDVVLANLLIPIVEAIGEDLAAAVVPDGHLVVSGLLADRSTGQVERALVAIGSGADDVLVSESDGWAAVIT